MNGICHIEIPSKDFEKAKRFYGDVFNWKFQDITEMSYMTFMAPDGVNGGFTKKFAIASNPGIVFYIEVEDIPAAIKKSEKAGGNTLVAKTEISSEFGYFAFINDLEGNRIGLWAKK
ncbi:MAG: VOC family protein [candidate division Zixibacteria bacterium]|nr:VOC family protein [candidate division Zixibacteria bacterium]